jgi:hypothetical protein
MGGLKDWRRAKMAEKEYIEREAAIAEVEEWHDMYPDSDAAREALSLAKRAIRKLPAADVRPVVLCRDCKHRFITPNGWHCPYAEWGIEDDDFCSCGEKREEG